MDVTVILPALNESKTIADIITVCNKSEYVYEVIVIDDGSTDNTSEISKIAGATVFRNEENKGKANAMLLGTKEAKTDTLLFLDADLMGLTLEHINDLIKPIINNEADLALGIFTGGRMKTDLAHKVTPFLSGQRCIKKDLFLEAVSSSSDLGYGIEVFMSLFLLKQKKRVMKIHLHNLTHVMKEEKNGKGKGMKNRFKMYEEILSVFFKK
jgi:polyisoprenyl-phosphate glycosyltransferase